jgi:hypothetical protein
VIEILQLRFNAQNHHLFFMVVVAVAAVLGDVAEAKAGLHLPARYGDNSGDGGANGDGALERPKHRLQSIRRGPRLPQKFSEFS